jgi:hypothetical protein
MVRIPRANIAAPSDAVALRVGLRARARAMLFGFNQSASRQLDCCVVERGFCLGKGEAFGNEESIADFRHLCPAQNIGSLAYRTSGGLES